MDLPGPSRFHQAIGEGLSDPNSYPVDQRGLTYTYAYIGIKRMGAGQFYLINIKDKNGDSYDGSKTYRLRVPPNVPVDQYWSLTAYDRETHALIKNVDRASRASNSAEVQRNADGSIDVYVGSEAPPGQQANWIPTRSGSQVRADVPSLRAKARIFRQEMEAARCRKR